MAIKDISVGQQQLVEIAKAIAKNVRLLILDEPTASLNEDDSEHLLKLLLEFKRNGLTSILISHKIHEITEVADSITILRDGATIETLVKGKDDIGENRIIKGMVGRELKDRFPPRERSIGAVAFEVKDWNAYSPLDPDRKVIKDVSLKVHKGEVIGLAGLMGAGRTELAMSIFGQSYGTRITGTAIKDGKVVDLSTVRKAITARISLRDGRPQDGGPEPDRGHQGEHHDREPGEDLAERRSSTGTRR